MVCVLLTPRWSIRYLIANTLQSVATMVEKLFDVQSLFSAVRNLKQSLCWMGRKGRVPLAGLVHTEHIHIPHRSRQTGLQGLNV